MSTLDYIEFKQLNKKCANCPRGVMVKAMDCEIVVSEFELQSRYYVHKCPWERYKPTYPPSYGLNSILNSNTVLLRVGIK